MRCSPVARTATLAVLALFASGCASTPSGFTDLGQSADGSLHSYGSQRVLVLRGSHYEMGLQHGRLLSRPVRTLVREELTWTNTAGLSHKTLAGMWKQLERHVPAHIHDEMRGLAEGSGASLHDIHLLHAMPSKFHCSGAATARSMTRDGKLYHSRSLDYALNIGVEDRMQNHALVIARFPTNGKANVVPAWAGFLGAVTGMNEAGISVGEKGSASDDESFDGMPMIFIVREVLRRSGTLAEAVEILRKGPRTCGFNFIVGSGDERLATAVEVTRNHFYLSGMGDDAENIPPHRALPDAVRRTNHFIGREIAKTQPRRSENYHPKNYREGTWLRYQRITEYLEAHRGRLDAPSMVALLRRYPPGPPCLHQAVMCPTDRIIWVSQAVDDRTSKTAGAQNQTFHAYRLTTRGIFPVGTLPPGGESASEVSTRRTSSARR